MAGARACIRPTVPRVSEPTSPPVVHPGEGDRPDDVAADPNIDPHERRAASQRDAAAFTARTGRPTIVNADGSWAPLGRGDRRSPAARRSA